MTEKQFTIFKVSWLTQAPGNEDLREEIVEHTYRIVKFLQDNSLVLHRLMENRGDITDEFSLTSDDLTAEGLAVMKAGYSRWLREVDKGMDPADVSILEAALARIR